MSEEQLKAFWEAVQADTSLQEKLRDKPEADSIASIAKEAGFEITADEVKEAQSKLSDEQLDGVAGGARCFKCEACSNWEPVLCLCLIWELAIGRLDLQIFAEILQRGWNDSRITR